MHRCIAGRSGARLLADQEDLRGALAVERSGGVSPRARAVAAVAAARRDGLAPQDASSPALETTSSSDNPYSFDLYEV